MDLTRQPPRRPSNASLAGIVGVARLADKARAHVAETLGDFVYGNNSGLDLITLEFLDTDADTFAEAADLHDDDALADWIRKASDLTDKDIADFNAHHLGREPDEAGMARLKERVERLKPEVAPTTVFGSIELDDWGTFREIDLASQAPRSPYEHAVAVVFGLARMADKARADKSGKLNDYIYNCPIDQAITEFLGFSAGDYQQAAWENPNDLELSDWVIANTDRSAAEVTAFNARIASRGPAEGHEQEVFDKTLDRVAPGRIDIMSWFDLLDLDDEASYGTTDLTRHPPRSVFDKSAGGLVHLARMIDKARAVNTGTLGGFWYGEDSGFDRRLLAYLDLEPEAFLCLITDASSDEDVLAHLEIRSAAEREAFNRDLTTAGPRDLAGESRLLDRVLDLDPSRTDIRTYAAWTQLDDAVTFARRKAPV